MDGILSGTVVIFLIVPISLKYGLATTLTAIVLAASIQIVQRHCQGTNQTSLGIWCHVLSYIAGIGIISRALATTLYYIDGLHGMTSFLKSFSPSFAISLITILIIITVVVLCSFGLEKSSLLRTILTFSIFASIIVLSINTSYHEWSKITLSTPDNISEVLKCTIVTLSGFTSLVIESNPNNNNNNCSNNNFVNQYDDCSRYFNNNNNSKSNNRFTLIVVFKVLTLSIIMAFIMLSISFNLFHLQQSGQLKVDKEVTSDIDVSILLFNILVNKWYRLIMLVLIILNFGLILPDMMMTCSYFYSRLAGRVFPIWIKKEIIFTGTNAVCILISGFLAIPMVTVMTLEQLIELITAGSLCGNCADFIYNIYKNHQPTYYCKDAGIGGDGAKYEMLATTLDESFDTNEDGHVSDDSGHSSDTDIDAVVAEFKERIKVATTMADPIVSEPTLYTGRRVLICLAVAIIFLIFSGITVNCNLHIISALSLLVAIVMMSIICCQPSRQFDKKNTIWITTIYLIFASALVCNFSMHIILTVLTWTIFCGVAWFLYNPASKNLVKQGKQLFQPKRRFSRYSQHSTSALTLVDTIHIIR